jgi:phosphoglycerol transferase
VAGCVLLEAWLLAEEHFEIAEYISFIHQKTTLYEDVYVDPETVTITFPEQKRNLIYIYLESMETTYGDVASGGSREVSLIPELTELAGNYITFSGNDSH